MESKQARGSLDLPSKYVNVWYNTFSAPFLAVRCLMELAIQEQVKYPEAAKVLRYDFYMDDVLTGTHTKKEACLLQQQLMELLKAGGFNLRK